jgi:arsenite transporter
MDDSTKTTASSDANVEPCCDSSVMESGDCQKGDQHAASTSSNPITKSDNTKEEEEVPISDAVNVVNDDHNQRKDDDNAMTSARPTGTTSNLDHTTPTEPHMSFFAKYLTIWIALAMGLGTALGAFFPAIPQALEKATVANIWIPGSVLVWIMIFPMMLGVRWNAIRQIHEHPGGLLLTTFVNWAVQPFAMYGLAVLFFNVIYQSKLDPVTQKEFIAGAVILGGSPCTAMVFVWSSLAKGDPNYTLAQVVVNDLILLILYVPTTKLLLNISDIELPWDTVFLSVILFVVVPFVLGVFTQLWALRREGGEELLTRIDNFFKPLSSIALVVLVVFIFISQAQVIVKSPVNVLLCMPPLILQTTLIFLLTYSIAYYACLPHNIAGPAAFIGSSNFFELAVALAITVYGPQSGAVLVTVVGVLVEVPVMLGEVAIVNRTKTQFERRLADEHCRCHKTTSSNILGRNTQQSSSS